MADAPAHDLDDATLEALIEMMFLAVHADGEFAEEERNEFADQVRTLSKGRIDGPKFSALMAKLEKSLAADGREERIAYLKTVFRADYARREAFSLAVRMTAADGVIRTSERELILELAEGLEIDNDVAADLVAELTKPLTTVKAKKKP